MRTSLTKVILGLLIIISNWSASSAQGPLTPLESKGCLQEGQSVAYNCTIPSDSQTVWSGPSFHCPSSSNSDDNKITLLPQLGNRGFCGPFSANVTGLNGRNETDTTIYFTANYTMNDENITCADSILTSVMNYPLNIGVVPDPPVNVTLTFPDQNTCNYTWIPPAIVTGGLRGYSLKYSGQCGTCSPNASIVSNDTLEALCTGWVAMGQRCGLEVQTVTQDCGFKSAPGNITSVLDNTFPTITDVTLMCSMNESSPPIRVDWIYDPPEVENTTILPGVRRFILNLSDGLNNTDMLVVNDTSARFYVIDHTQTPSLVGTDRQITVTVDTEIGNRTNTSLMFSVMLASTNSTPTLTARQCVEVSINSRCIEPDIYFMTRLLYSDGSCEQNSVCESTQNYSLTKHSVCIPIEEGMFDICYSAQVLYNGTVVGNTDREQLSLLQCNTSSLDFIGQVLLNTTNGTVTHGDTVLHNSLISLSCQAPECMFNGTRKTRCINGSFSPMVTNTTGCSCSNGLSGEAIAGISVAAVIVFLIIIIAVVLPVVFKLRKPIQTYYMKGNESKQKLKEMNETSQQPPAEK